MDERDLEIQELRQQNAQLIQEKTELARKNRGLMAKNDKLTEKLHLALADAVRYRRQVQALMGWEMEGKDV